MVSLENLEMTREDFISLKSALKKYGLSNDDIEEMENKVAAGGLTWSGFLSLVGQKTGISQQNLLPSVDNEQQRLLQGFFQKLGFQPDAAEELVTDLKQGRLGKVWDAVSGRLSTMKSEDLVSVDSDELAALSKAMKLPQATADRLAETFGSLRRDGLSTDELKAALAAVRQQVQQAEDQITLRKQPLWRRTSERCWGRP